MARVRKRSRNRADGGSSWISYSDMMAAMLLVFVLILCYSLYQYFLMLETKTAELDEQKQQLVIQQNQLDDQTLQISSQQSQLLLQQSDLDAKQQALDRAQAVLAQQQKILDEQTAALAAQQSQLTTANSTLADREAELIRAQAELEVAQNQLASQQTQLNAVQQALDAQAVKIDDLIGIRTRIIQELSTTLSASNLRATVDKTTGDIVLDSTVFFETGKSDIKESGQALLNQFIPVYLSVLLQSEYEDYLGEIIIEGHTDTKGDYLMNLELSQQRALGVAKYCLQMPGLSGQQQEKLRAILTAKGKSYSSPIYQSDGNVDMDRSRRVEFKFSLKDAEMIEQMNRILSQQ